MEREEESEKERKRTSNRISINEKKKIRVSRTMHFVTIITTAWIAENSIDERLNGNTTKLGDSRTETKSKSLVISWPVLNVIAIDPFDRVETKTKSIQRIM